MKQARAYLSAENLLPVLLGLILLFYTYVRFSEQPYLGFEYDPLDGRITRVIHTRGSSNLLPEGDQLLLEGDQLLRVGRVNFLDYSRNTRQPLLIGTEPGDKISIAILRDGRQQIVEWVLPGPTLLDISGRLYTIWIPYVFWGFGTATLFFLRPKDVRWKLMVAFNYLTAVWLMTGILSSSHFWYSSTILHTATWLCLPIYLHLHWVFPKPLGRLPRPLLVGIYLAGGILAILEWFHLVPITSFFIGFVLAACGSIILLGAHAVMQPDQRRDLILLALAALGAVLFALFIGVTGIFGKMPAYGSSAIYFLPIIPAAYFFAVYRRQLGGLELRANRAVAWVLYAAVLFIASVAFIGVVGILMGEQQVSSPVGVAAAVITGLVTAVVYPYFQRWVERRLLGMPLPPSSLLQTYPARITTSLQSGRLISLLRDELLPSLLVRQAALLRIRIPITMNEPPSLAQVFTLEVSAELLPRPDEIPVLLAQSGQERLSISKKDPVHPCPWVRLALPLVVEGETVGLFLLGRRDPDDRYAPTEIPTLQALMDQTAVAFLNIEQAERLRILYQTNIGRQETEHSQAARELHDEVLGQLALLSMSLEEIDLPPQFSDAYQKTVQGIRKIISGLRPSMLNFGLRSALEELVDELSTQSVGKVELELNVAKSEARFADEVELHLYRIVQQACQNALRHAHARHICIQGCIESTRVILTVEDDGVGFAAGGGLDLPALLASGHYGLAGMHERAAMIGGQLKINSSPGSGTRVQIVLEVWN